MLFLFSQLFLLKSRASSAWPQDEHATDVPPTEDNQGSQNIFEQLHVIQLVGISQNNRMDGT